MKMQGENVEQGTIAEKTLRSLTSKFDYVVCSIEESNDVTKLSVDELQSSLMVHEQRMKEHKEGEQALKVTHGGRNGTRGRGRSGGRRARGRCRQTFNKELIKCFNCHKLGHFQNECPSLDEKANYAEFDEEELLLMAITQEESSNSKKVWFLDCCSNHICGYKE